MLSPSALFENSGAEFSLLLDSIVLQCSCKYKRVPLPSTLPNYKLFISPMHNPLMNRLQLVLKGGKYLWQFIKKLKPVAQKLKIAVKLTPKARSLIQDKFLESGQEVQGIVEKIIYKSITRNAVSQPVQKEFGKLIQISYDLKNFKGSRRGFGDLLLAKWKEAQQSLQTLHNLKVKEHALTSEMIEEISSRVIKAFDFAFQKLT